MKHLYSDSLVPHDQPSQNEPAASSTNRLLWEFDRLLAVRKCIILTNNKEKRKTKKKRQKTTKPKRKVPEHYSKGLKALVERACLHPLF